MILIVLKIKVRPDRRADWLRDIRRYTEAVRAEEGSLAFECFESIETPNHFSVIEGFVSGEAGDAHVQTDHFKDFMQWFPKVIAEAPSIVNVELPGEGWSRMAELE